MTRLTLPDGTSYTPLTWDELVPHECDQGGYWLCGPWCDVYGNGKLWIRVRPAGSEDSSDAPLLGGN